MQHALPVTFGLKLAGTLDALLRWQMRLREMRSGVLVPGGAAGTLTRSKRAAGCRSAGKKLDLNLPDTPWHSQRDRLLRVGAWYAGCCGALGKFANDFSLLMQTEVAEVAEPVAEGRGGSSTMPHKRNPISCAAIAAAAQRPDWWQRCMPARFSSMSARWADGKRSGKRCGPEITLVSGAMVQSEALVREMQVFAHKMRASLDITHGLIMAEAVTLTLAEFIGKAEAHHRVEGACVVRRWMNRVRC